MKEKIKQHFDSVFADAPKTRKAIELKQEMLQNALDKFHDLVSDGYSEEDAYQNVVRSIGDVSELFPELEEKNLLNLPEKDRKKKALLTSISVGLYIFAGVVFLFFDMVGQAANRYWENTGFRYDQFGLCIAALICIPPTVMLVYAANMYPNYTRKEKRSVVEDMKALRYNDNKSKAVKKSINTIIWTVAMILYFIISFSTYSWNITWLIFLIAGCVQAVVGLIFTLNADEKHL